MNDDSKSKSIGERLKPPSKDEGGVGRLKLKGGMVLKKSSKKWVQNKFVIHAPLSGIEYKLIKNLSNNN